VTPHWAMTRILSRRRDPSDGHIAVMAVYKNLAELKTILVKSVHVGHWRLPYTWNQAHAGIKINGLGRIDIGGDR